MSTSALPTVATPESVEFKVQLHALRPEPGLNQASRDLMYAMGFHWLQSAEFDKARSAFELLWRACPDQPDYAGGLAQSALGQGHPDEAASYFLLALALDENNAGHMLGLGRAYRACQLPAHARLALQLAEAMGQQPRQDPATADLARACLALMGDA